MQETSDESPAGAQKSNLFVEADSVWHADERVISVCWEPGPIRPDDYTGPNNADDLIEHHWVADALRSTWEAYSQVRFVGWGTCGSADIHIHITHMTPHADDLGDGAGGLAGDGVSLNFTFDQWPSEGWSSTHSEADREQLIREGAVHEFGHVLSFGHEQDRSDRPAFASDGSGENGDTNLGVWDYESVMNYCNPIHDNGAVLSATDAIGVRQFYGDQDVRMPVWENQSAVWPFIDWDLVLSGVVLTTGQKKTYGHWYAPNQPPAPRYSISLQTDGNLVVYDESWNASASSRVENSESCSFDGTPQLIPLTATHSVGSGANTLTMQTDGNLVLSNASGPVWSSNTSGHPTARLVFQNDGNVVIYEEQAVWATNTNSGSASPPIPSASLKGGQSLLAGAEIRSPNDRYGLRMQTDGNAVLYDGTTPIWSSNTMNSGANELVMQSDGNLVVYGPDGPKWASNTKAAFNADRAHPVLRLQDDGNLVIYRPKALWEAESHNSFSNAGAANLIGPRGPLSAPILTANNQIKTKSGHYALKLDSSGDLAIWKDNNPYWSAGAGNLGAVSGSMEADGRFVLRNSVGAEVWATTPPSVAHGGDGGGYGAYLSLREDGNLSVVKPNKIALWASGTVRHQGAALRQTEIPAARPLLSGQSIVSPNGLATLTMQTDGNLVLFDGTSLVWSSQTNGNPGAVALLMPDGEFRVQGSGGVLWSTGTSGRKLFASYVALQDDGNLVLYRATEVAESTPFLTAINTLSLVTGAPLTATTSSPAPSDIALPFIPTVTTTCAADGRTLTGTITSHNWRSVNVPIAANNHVTLTPGVYEITWVATDACGDQQTVKQMLTVTRLGELQSCVAGQSVLQGTASIDNLTPGIEQPYCAVLGAGADYIVTKSSSDLLMGGPGADYLDSGGGNDTIFGGADDDFIYGAIGGELVGYGEAGDDGIYATAASKATLYGGWGNDGIYGSEGADWIVPGPGKDGVIAGGGNDSVVIYDMCEVVSGEELEGGPGMDTLYLPVPLAELQAAGVIVTGFEGFVEDTTHSLSYLSECF